MPWNRRGGSDSSALPPRSICDTLVRYAKSSQSNEVNLSDAGNVLSGVRSKTWEALVTTRSVRLVIETLRVSLDDVHGVNAVTSAGVVDTPERLTLSFRCRMISLATDSVRVQRLTVSAPVALRSSGSVQSCPQAFSTGRFVSSPKCQTSTGGSNAVSCVMLPSTG